MYLCRCLVVDFMMFCDMMRGSRSWDMIYDCPYLGMPRDFNLDRVIYFIEQNIDKTTSLVQEMLFWFFK